MEKKTIYVVIRIDRWVEFKTKMANVHIYSNQSSNRERIVEYARQIKKTYPDRQVAVVSREKAKELYKKCREYCKDQEIKAMGLKPRMSIDELNKKYYNIK